MNKINHNQKHLTLSDRVYIEQERLQSNIFRIIANVLHKDSSTISKEIHLHAAMPKTTSFKAPRCKHIDITILVRYLLFARELSAVNFIGP